MEELKRRIRESSGFIRDKRPGFEPEIAIILGTGLGALADEVEEGLSIPYSEIPHFPISTVEFHAGELVLGRIGDRNVVAMKGRFHRYEGYTMQQITFPVRVMRDLGAKVLVVSNAAGGINRYYEPGDLMIITDHINLMGDNPLIGPNDEELGPRFPDMSEPYDRRLIALAERIALEEGIKVHKGVYIAVTGPNLETAAEYRFFRIIGADAVGMSTVPEVIVAIHSGMRVFGISVITDKCVPDALERADVEKILKVAREAEPKLTRITSRLIREMDLE